MDPLSIAILAALVALAVVLTVVIVELVILTFEWLTESFNKLKQGDVNEIGFTVKKAIENGEVVYIQGVFNKLTNEVVGNKVVEIHAEQVDERLKDAHGTNEVVVYS